MSAAGSTAILTLLAVISLQGLLLLAAPTLENAHITPDIRLDESVPVRRAAALKRQRRHHDDHWQGYSHGHSGEELDEPDWGVNDDSHSHFHGHSGRRSHGYFDGHSHGRSRPPFFGFGFGNWRPHPQPPVPFGFGNGPNGGRYNTYVPTPLAPFPKNKPDCQPMPEAPPTATTTSTPVTRRTKATKGPTRIPVTTTTTPTTTTTTEEPLLIDLRSSRD